MKPTIYLGLGGTGNLAISYAKRLFEQEGPIPAHVAFLGVDYQTNMDQDSNLASDISSDFMKFTINADPRQMYQVGMEQRGEYRWMFKGNERYIAKSIANGASQVRTTGRLYSEMILPQFISKLRTLINNVCAVTGHAGVDAGNVNIHMVMSVAGGTGAGSFITLATAIRDNFPSANLYGYGVSHNVFRAMDPLGNKTPNVDLNCVSSLIDLDYMMTADISNPITIDTGMRTVTLTRPPFDLFYVIDNTSQSGHVVKHIKNLSEIVGICLYSCGSEAEQKLDAVLSNIGPDQGFGNVGRKLGWVQTLGACQVVYKGDLLAKLYSLKASNILVNKMLNCDLDEQQAKDWTKLTEPNINILEDGEEFNLLTDSIVSPKTLNSLKDPNLDQNQTEAERKDVVNKYITNLTELPTQEVLNARLNELKVELRKQISFYLSSDCGIGNALKFLECLNAICNRDKIEMEEEMSKFNASVEDKIGLLPKKYSEYQEEVKGISFLSFNKAEKKQVFLEDIVGRFAKSILKDTYEAKRREAARNIFIGLIAEIEILTQKLRTIAQKLTNLSSSYIVEIDKCTSASSSAMIFEYDLSYNERQNLKVDPSVVVVSDFINTLGVSLADIDDSILEAKIEEYTLALPQAEEYRKKLITEIVDQLPENEYKKLKEEIERKSDRWLRLDPRGQVVNGQDRKTTVDAIASSWLLTYYHPKEAYQSRFETDNAFRNNSQLEPIKIDKEATKQRMIFCRLEGSIIPYCIAFLDEITMLRYEKIVNQVNAGDMMFMPHFDKTIFDKIKKEDFKLKPEMKKEAIFYWVCGQLFGFTEEGISEEIRIMECDAKGMPIKQQATEIRKHKKYICYYRGKYVFYDESAMEGRDGKWISLDNTTRRDVAYNYFKTAVLSIPERKDSFRRLIIKEFAKEQAVWKGRIDALIKDGFHKYINELVCSDKNSLTYFARESEEVNILREEWAYIEKELYNALLNFK